MRILRWMCNKTRLDKIRNDNIKKRVGLETIIERMVENILMSVEHVERRHLDYVVRRVDHMNDTLITR